MAVPSTNVKFSDIYAEANGSYSSGVLSLATMSFFSYFQGPNGSNTISYNAWGQGQSSGANRIYNTSAKTTNIQVGDFTGDTYFYDQSAFKCNLTVYNNLPADAPFPPPGVFYDVQDVNLTIRDNTDTYSYINGNSGVVISAGNGGGTFGPTDLSQSTSPIIRSAYWEIVIASSPNFPGATADLVGNGSTLFTGQAVNGGGAPTTFNWGSYSAVVVATGYGGTTAGLDFVLTIY